MLSSSLQLELQFGRMYPDHSIRRELHLAACQGPEPDSTWSGVKALVVGPEVVKGIRVQVWQPKVVEACLRRTWFVY